MKTSMRKILVFLSVVGCLFVSGTFREASGQQGQQPFGPITGTYACTFSGTTLVSPQPFDFKNTQYVPQPGIPANVNTSSGHGTWTFHKDGTGSAEISLIYSLNDAFPPGYYGPPQINPQAISFDFTYTLAKDGTITTTLEPGTFEATYWLDGVYHRYNQDLYSFTGMVSLDRMTITLNRTLLGFVTRIYSEPEGYGTRYAIGHSSYVLIKVGQ